MFGKHPRLLITGGLGNVGLWLTEYFAEAGYEVCILARKSKNLAIESRITLIEADISDPEACKVALVGQTFDYVIHLASVNETFLDNYPEKALKVNTWGTRNILQALPKTNLKNFIYFSTFHVYGRQSGNIDEGTPALPRHDYATTHYFAERYVTQFHQTHQLPYTILRLTNGYGAPKDITSSKWYLILNDLAKMAFEQQEIRLRSNGKALRDFIWLGDVCKATEQIINLPKAPNQVFNLSAGESLSLLDVAQEVQQAYSHAFGQNIAIEVNQKDNTIAQSLLVSNDKLKQCIDHSPKNMLHKEIQAVFKLLTNKQEAL